MRRVAFAPIAILIGACGAQDLVFDPVDSGADAAAEGDVADAADDASGCSSDSDCGLAGLHCALASHQCVACVSSDQCRQPYNVCEQNLCVQCADDRDCPNGRCEPTTHRCVPSCADGGFCPNDLVCNQRGDCVACTSDAFCQGSRSGSMCDLTVGQCVQCVSDSDCSLDRGLCNRATGRCVECLYNQSCPRGQVCAPQYNVCVDTGTGGFEGGPGPGNYVGTDARVGP